MCRLHEDRVTYSGCKLLKENSIQKENGSISYLLQNFSFSNSQPYDPHLLVHQAIYQCEKVPEGTSEGTCGTVTRFMEGGTLTEVGASRAKGQCLVCVAAEKAVQESCFQIDYVCKPTLNGCICD
jgi:hypothetical protein